MSFIKISGSFQHSNTIHEIVRSNSRDEFFRIKYCLPDTAGRQGSVSVTDRGHSATVSTHRIVRETVCQAVILGLFPFVQLSFIGCLLVKFHIRYLPAKYA